MNYSITQAANLAMFASLIVFALKYFNIALSQEEVTTFLGLLLGVGGMIVAWYKRYQQGDLKLSGFRRD